MHYETHEFHTVAKERNSHNFGVLRGILDVMPYPWVWNPNHDLFTRGISPVFGLSRISRRWILLRTGWKRPVLLLFRATNLAPILAWTCPNNVLTITLSYDPNVNRSVFPSQHDSLCGHFWRLSDGKLRSKNPESLRKKFRVSDRLWQWHWVLVVVWQCDVRRSLVNISTNFCDGWRLQPTHRPLFVHWL